MSPPFFENPKADVSEREPGLSGEQPAQSSNAEGMRPALQGAGEVRPPRQAGTDGAPQSFVDYVVENYPRGTRIEKPEWHAPKLWRAAVRAGASK